MCQKWHLSPGQFLAESTEILRLSQVLALGRHTPESNGGKGGITDKDLADITMVGNG